MWVETSHQYGISAHVPETSFRGVSSGNVAKCRLFLQATDVNVWEVAQRSSFWAHKGQQITGSSMEFPFNLIG